MNVLCCKSPCSTPLRETKRRKNKKPIVEHKGLYPEQRHGATCRPESWPTAAAPPAAQHRQLACQLLAVARSACQCIEHCMCLCTCYSSIISSTCSTTPACYITLTLALLFSTATAHAHGMYMSSKNILGGVPQRVCLEKVAVTATDNTAG